jgi:pyridoxamine 5'-phosphate oxidase
MINIAEIRKEYSSKTLNEQGAKHNPMEQFSIWLSEAEKAEVLDPNAMTLATSTFDGHPSARIVHLQSLEHAGFTFFTNYESRKSKEILQNPYAAAVFLWSELDRQIRVEGKIHKLLASESDKYFELRPEKTKLETWASPQSQPVPSRKYMEDLLADFEEEFEGKPIKRPENWGGYVLVPSLIEFWQGRQNHLHDRIQYIEENGKWRMGRLAP